jgi:hypothetical protein
VSFFDKLFVLAAGMAISVVMVVVIGLFQEEEEDLPP